MRLKPEYHPVRATHLTDAQLSFVGRVVAAKRCAAQLRRIRAGYFIADETLWLSVKQQWTRQARQSAQEIKADGNAIPRRPREVDYNGRDTDKFKVLVGDLPATQLVIQ